jgi:hypothetical protein
MTKWQVCFAKKDLYSMMNYQITDYKIIAKDNSSIH